MSKAEKFFALGRMRIVCFKWEGERPISTTTPLDRHFHFGECGKFFPLCSFCIKENGDENLNSICSQIVFALLLLYRPCARQLARSRKKNTTEQEKKLLLQYPSWSSTREQIKSWPRKKAELPFASFPFSACQISFLFISPHLSLSWRPKSLFL